MSPSHEPAYAEDGKPKLRYQLYHEEKAKGGIALTMFGGSTNVAPDSPPVFGQLYAGDDDIIPWFRQLADRMHAHGTATMVQLTHLGRRTVADDGDWLPTISASSVREPAHRSFPKEMEESDIRRVVRAFGAAARRCREGGLDGLELEAYGHLIDQFWSPLVNSRSDRYGGSLENRMRFAIEVLEAIRREVGDEFIVGIRMTGARGRAGRPDRGGRARDRDDPGPDRDDRLRQHRQGLHRDRRSAVPRHPGSRDAAGTGARARRAVPRARRPAGLPRRQDRRRRDRPLRHRRGAGGHGRDDAGRTWPTRTSSASCEAGQKRPDPAVRRGVEVHQPHLRRARRRCASTTRRPDARRRSRSSRSRAAVRAGRSWSWGRGRPAWRPPASRPSEGIGSSCWRRPRIRAARSASRRGRHRGTRDLIGIVDWLVAECRHAGVELRLRHRGRRRRCHCPGPGRGGRRDRWAPTVARPGRGRGPGRDAPGT